MGTGYTRNDTPNNIADGNVINASDLDGEFDAVQAAFNGSTGHSHDGTTGEGPQIATAGLADNAVTTAKITDANVTTAKIADDAVTSAKLDTNIQIAGTLGVTGVSSFADGSNSAPSLTFTSDTNTGIYRGGTDILKFVTAGTDAITINASQNVTFHGNIAGGLTSTGDLDVSASNPRIRMFETDTTDLNTQFQTNGGELLIKTLLDDASNSTTRIKIDHSTGDINFYEDTGTTPKFFWDASAESLGIGTTTPDGIFEATGGRVYVRGSNENFTLGVGRGGQTSNYFLGATASSSPDLLFSNNSGTTNVTFTHGGSVGIGTSTPTSQLHIEGATPTLEMTDTDLAAGHRTLIQSNTSHGGLILDIDRDNSVASTAFITKIDGSECMRIDSSGNVGIGTATVSDELHIKGPDPAIRIEDTTAVGYARIQSLNGSLILQSDEGNTVNNSNLRFEIDGGEIARFDDDGNLLVGKTAAGSGSEGVEAKADGSLYATKDIASGGQVGIYNRLTSDGDFVSFRKDGSTVGSISTEGSRLAIGTGDVGLKFDSGLNQLIPFDISSNAVNDDVITLGRSSSRFKNLYLSGGVYLGGTGSDNLLDDYEEGTWSPTFTTNSGSAASGAFSQANYTKIGRLVHIHARITNINTTGTTSSSEIRISGLPFTIDTIGAYNSAVSDSVTFQGSRTQLTAEMNTNEYIRFLQIGTGNSEVATDHADINSGTSDIFFSGFYITDQ